MRHARISAWAAAGLLVVAAGCASSQPPATTPAPPSLGAASMQGAPVEEQDYGWAALVEADNRIKHLEAVRDGMDDPFYEADVDRQIATIVANRDALLDEMTVADGRVHDPRIRQLRWELQRSLSEGTAEMQRKGLERP